MTIDLTRGDFRTLFAPHAKQHTLSKQQPYVLQPGEFVLGKTHEHITLPVKPGKKCLAARVEGRSSYARCGLLVHFTAPTIHAGFEGTITLELMNLGPLPIQLSPQMPICQLVFEYVSGKIIRNDSQFQGQVTAGGGKKKTSRSK